MKYFVRIVRQDPSWPDFLDSYVSACAEIAETFRVFFRKLYNEMPESRADLMRWIPRLTCAEIEENRGEEYYDELFGIIWYADLKYKFNRHEIERALRTVQLEAAEDRIFPRDN